MLALIIVAIVAVSTAPAPQRRRRIIIIVIRRRPRDVSSQMQVQNSGVSPIGEHPLESIITPSKNRFAREAGDEPQPLNKDENINHATINDPLLLSYISDIELDLNRRYAGDAQKPEIMYVMEPLEDEEQ